jgi:hypothetical protein
MKTDSCLTPWAAVCTPTRIAPESLPAPAHYVEVVTLARHELEQIVEQAAERGYRRAAEERERTVGRLADRLDLPQHKEVLDTKQAAAYVGRRSTDTILRWIGRGLPAEERQGRYWIRRADLDAWLTAGADG